MINVLFLRSQALFHCSRLDIFMMRFDIRYNRLSSRDHIDAGQTRYRINRSKVGGDRKIRSGNSSLPLSPDRGEAVGIITRFPTSTSIRPPSLRSIAMKYRVQISVPAIVAMRNADAVDVVVHHADSISARSLSH